jgi:hypothetical protein
MPVLLFGGVLNTLALGLQVYYWIILALAIAAVGSYVGWHVLFWSPLKPLWGLFYAAIRHEQVAFTFDSNLNFVLKSEKKAKLIFNETPEQAKKAQKVWDYSPSGMIGKTTADLILDADRWTELDSPARQEIDKAVTIWNEAHPGTDEIHTLLRFGALLQAGMITCPIDSTITVPWLRIRSAFSPKSMGAFAGYTRQLAKLSEQTKQEDLNKYGIYILVFSLLICIMMIGVKVLKLI